MRRHLDRYFDLIYFGRYVNLEKYISKSLSRRILLFLKKETSRDRSLLTLISNLKREYLRRDLRYNKRV